MPGDAVHEWYQANNSIRKPFWGVLVEAAARELLRCSEVSRCWGRWFMGGARPVALA